MKATTLLLVAAGLALGLATGVHDAFDGAGSPADLEERATAVALPTEYTGHRFFVRPVTVSGDTLRFYTDTGGAGAWVTRDAAERTALRKRLAGSVAPNGDSMFVAEWPDLREDASVPPPGEGDSTLFVFDPRTIPAEMPREVLGWDGMLGFKWFIDRAWTFDYGNGLLYYHTRSPVLDEQHPHTVPLHFGAADGGAMHMDVFNHIPRMQVEVAGEQLDVYFDTGATTALSDSTVAVLDDGLPAIRAGSFLSPAVAARWRSSHPEWRVIKGGAHANFDFYLHQVPSMRIGGHVIGPVWFMVAPASEMFDRLSSIAGMEIHAMVGGSAFHHFDRITVDYPNAIALFEK